MRIKGLWKVAVTLLFMLTVSGCGDGNSNTNGTLALSASASVNTSGVAAMVATASVTPVATGMNVNLVAKQYGNVAGVITVVETYVVSADTDKTGTVTFNHNFTRQAFDTILQVTATCQGLSQTAADITILKFP